MLSASSASSASSVASAAPALAALVLAAVGLTAQSAPNPFAGGARGVETRHVSVAPSISRSHVAPGTSLSVVLDITPKRTMHVYAPGRHDYQVVRVVVEPRPWLRVLPVAYPPSQLHHFAELDEKVEVYSAPFTLRQELAVLATPAARRSLAAAARATIEGHLEYQACDDRVCYATTKVPFSFTLDVTPFDRRPPEE